MKPGETLHMVLQLRMRVASSMSGPILSEPREKIGELTHDDVFQKSHANVSGTEKVSSGAVTAESSTSATLLSGSEHDDEERKHSTFIYSNIEADVDCCAKCYLNLTEKGILALLSGRGGESAEGRTLTHMSVFQREELKKLNGGEEEEILSPIQCDICSKALMPL